jgi:hypothetical protein
VGALAVMTLGLILLGSALVAGAVSGDAPQQSDGSTWAEGPSGASRLFALLVAAGRHPQRHEGDLVALPMTGLLVALNPPGGLRPLEEAALLDRVERGANLILATESVPPDLASLGLRTSRHPLTGVASPRIPSAQAQAGSGLVSAGDTLLDAVPGLAPIFATDEGVLLGGLVAGEGAILFLTDPYLLSNAGLEDPVNLRLALSMFPADQEPITFLEGLHGYTTARGLLPWLWRAGWGAMLLAAILTATAAGWRAASLAPRLVPETKPIGGGLSRLAWAVGRMRAAQGLHRHSMSQLLEEARRRRIPEDHPAMIAGRRAKRNSDLTPAAALEVAVALERTWR